MHSTRTVGLSDARPIIDVGIAEADRIGAPSNIAVADAGGGPVAHLRMDGAQLGSIEHSIDKAHTSVLVRPPAIWPGTPNRGEFWSMALSGVGRVLVFAGGLPLRIDDEVVGAVGVSDGSPERDTAVAKAAAL
ncbi:GlcG/HbpS family heme-binding protein [Streptomyces sp. YIM 132580]|uniref:GlcG/HbpS family heme-binding protein n=1 Tax=Streptomyces sp. YIM 132580 TaxID=2691958 RepID=UPI00136967C7|nr:heme-binding protein [Streptomyces sp. YIM 132580]MXG26655.1 heme-binding protein [Streptomyces sp. YIM 132580]